VRLDRNQYEQLKKKKLFLLDMDGTIYLDDQLFAGTLEFLDYVKESGGRYLFLTNNSSRGVDAYVAKLRRLGIPAEPEDFLTSVDATIAFLKKRYGGESGGADHTGCQESWRQMKIYLMGTESFRNQMENEGFLLTETADEDTDILLMGFDRELTYRKLEDASWLLTCVNVEYFATNPDWVCPTAWGSVPDCGSMAQMLEHATGRLPYFIGKPQPDMVLMALEKYGYRPEDAVLIGDRIYTDIACGYNAGIDTIFVLSGEGTLADAENTATKPAYIIENIEELYRRLV